MEIKLGTRTITDLSETDDYRIAALIWGDAGCGKTTLAATAPGDKLWLQFDADGTLSLKGRKDIHVLDLSSERNAALFSELKKDDPFGLSKVLVDNPQIETVVVDSLTSLTVMALEYGVEFQKNNHPGTKASLEEPGLAVYGTRNTVVLRTVISLMRLTKRLKRHIIFISHEDTATLDTNGVVLFITMSLGGKIAPQIGLQLSEVWWMTDTGKERKIALRPCRQRKPMKTRMFDATTDAPEFVWKYNAKEWKGDGIEAWFTKWKESGGAKVSLPK